MNLNLASEKPYEIGHEHEAWFEDPAAEVAYRLTWVPGYPSFQPRICAFPGPQLPAGVKSADLLMAMDAVWSVAGLLGAGEEED